MRFSRDIEHPDITHVLQTGRSPWESEQSRCERCGDELGEDVYDDLDYEYLCKDCLLELHKKAW